MSVRAPVTGCNFVHKTECMIQRLRGEPTTYNFRCGPMTESNGARETDRERLFNEKATVE